MRRIGLAVLVLGILLLAGIGLLVEQSARLLRDGEHARHEAVASRIFDELEDQLNQLLQREHGRSFHQYRHLYVPETALSSSRGWVASELASVPDEPFVLGWFQYDPYGRFSTPLRPDVEERSLLRGAWSPPSSLDSVETELRRLTAPLEDLPEFPRAEPPEEPDRPDEALVALRGAGTEPAVSREEPPPAALAAPSKKGDAGVDGRKLRKPKAEPEVEEAQAPTTAAPVQTSQVKSGDDRKTQSVAQSLNKAVERRPSGEGRVAKTRSENVYGYQSQSADPVPEYRQQAEPAAGRRLADAGAQWDARSSGEVVAAIPPSPAAAEPNLPPVEPGGPQPSDFSRSDRDAGGDGDTDAEADADADGGGEDPSGEDDGFRDGVVEAQLEMEEDDGREVESAKRASAEPEPLGDTAAEETRVASTSRRRGLPPPRLPGARKAKQARSDEAAPTAAEPPPADDETANEAAAPAARALEPADETLQRREGARGFDGADRTGADPDERAARSDPQDAPPPPPNEGEAEPPALAAAALEPVAPRPPRTYKELLEDTRVPGDLAPRGRGNGWEAGAPAPPPPGSEVDVVLSGLEGRRVAPDRLVLYRRVELSGQTLLQGLVLRLPELTRHLRDEVVSGTALDGYLELDWLGLPGEAAATDATYSFRHDFAEPFAGLAAVARLAPLPRESADPTRFIAMLTLVLVLLTGLGLLALYRMTSVVVQFAERRNNFVSAVSHELKTPLTAIRMYAEMLRDGIVPSEEKRQEYYTTITDESERLSRLINNVLELAKLEKGTRSVALQVGPPGPVLREAVRVLGSHARSRGFSLELRIPEELPEVSFEHDALLQVLINLVDNALKFSEGATDKRIVIEATPGPDGVDLRVRDHGPGVPPAQLGRIFQPFFRGERELTRRTKGTGIGLSLVRGLVERMGGRVAARNHPGGGFEVQIALPAR